MKWSFVFCLLLASSTLARPRTKRSIGHLKSLIVNKLFGIGGKTVIIARPILSNNNTFQLFMIPGIDDFLIKVTKNDKKHEKDEMAHKPTQEIKDPVIVKPEVAIIGSYLGTTTQKETLLAIEMVKNLVRSGILTDRLDSSMQELLIPQSFGGYIGEGILTQPMQVITEEEGHISVPEYPEFFMPSELKLTNPNSKYYYKQKGPDADMTYESHDNKDVLVTRTEKLTQNLQVSDAAKKNTVGNNKTPISQPLRINGPPGPYYANQGMNAGRIPLPTQNLFPLYNINQGISANMPGKAQNPSSGFYLNQGMMSGNVPEKGQIPYPGYHVSQGHGSGNMPGYSQNPNSGYYVDQGIISGQDKNPPAYYVNQGVVTGGTLGQVPYGAPTSTYNFNSDMIGNAPPTNNVNPNMMPGYFGPAHPPSVYYVNSGDVGISPGQIPPYLSNGMDKPNLNQLGMQFMGNDLNGGAIMADVGITPGQIPPYLSHGMGNPNVNEIGMQFIGNGVNGGAFMADGNPSLQMDPFVNPYYFGNNAQRVIICKEKHGKTCPNDKTEKITLNPTQLTNKPVKQQGTSNINSTFGNAKKNVVKEFLKNHTVNGQIVTQYSYQQINSHSNKNYTEVKLSEPASVETNKDLNKEFVYIPPGDSSIAMSLKNEGNDDKNAFTSKVNVRMNKEEMKRFMPSNRLKSNVRSNFKQNPIVVAEKRSNETDEQSTKSDDNNKGEIPGSTY